MASTLFLGLDIGTTTMKAVAFTEAGQPVATGTANTQWTVTSTGAETTARHLIDSAMAALAALLDDCPPGHIAALGITGLAESGVLTDRSGTAVGPVIAWHDTRDEAELSDLRADFGDDFSATTGLPMRQQWSLTKQLWLVRHVPEVAEAVRRFNVPEWIVKSLGGEEATEQSLAARTGWLNLAERRWWPQVLDWSGATESLMPPLVAAGTPLGRVGSEVGLTRLAGAVLTVAGHDHQVAAIGAGAAGAGDQLDSCGTAEALVRTVLPGLDRNVVRSLADAGITVGWHAAPGHWSLVGATQGGLTLQRILALLGHPREELDRQALAMPNPRVRVDAPPVGRVGIYGISDDESPAGVWRAALEAVTDQVAALHDAMTAATGRHRSFVVTGGWSASQALLEIKRRRFGPIVVSPIKQTGARGAALLAGVAAGATTRTDAFPAGI